MKRCVFVAWIICIVSVIFLMIPAGSEAQGVTVTPTFSTPSVYIEIMTDGTWHYAATPTVESITETPTPLPTVTPDMTCYITPKDSNINIRISPQVGTTVVGLMQVGMETVPVGFSNGWYKVWWPGDTNYPKSSWGWTLGSLYNTRGDCSKLPLS